MLTEILNLLKERGPMSLAEISRHFKSEISAMEGMLNTLEAKGRIARLDTKCSKCKEKVPSIGKTVDKSSKPWKKSRALFKRLVQVVSFFFSFFSSLKRGGEGR